MDYELKARFDLIQGCLDACAEHSFNTLVNNLESKRKYLSEERYHALHQYELNEARCELNSLYYSVPLISEIADLHEHTDWLWNSGIFESNRNLRAHGGSGLGPSRRGSDCAYQSP